MGCDWRKCQSSCIWDVWNESVTDDAEFRRKFATRRKVADAIRSLVNVRGLLIECARV